MTEHKFTDEEIIKALECCHSYDAADCSQCSYERETHKVGVSCVNVLIADALALITRQKAEIENLVNAVDNSTKGFLRLHDEYQEQKAEIAYWQDEAVNAKRETAMEIFEEIEVRTSVFPIENNCSIVSLETLAELKKKYTEVKNGAK